ncbi:MAG TPA: hypothetical protein VMX11_01415 [Actinomycetes bacterium]|nr:hypothetical protein [Actinomycetes bacterium]
MTESEDGDASLLTERLLTSGGGARRADILGWGFSRALIDRMLRRRELERRGRGYYVLAAPADTAELWQARRSGHLCRAAAVAGPGRVLGLRTAALAWGLPVAEMPNRVGLIRPKGSRQLEGSLVVRCDLPRSQITFLNGVPVTTLARTAADLALRYPAPQALVTLDAALRRGVDRAEVHDMLTDGCPGVISARQTLDWADGHAESPLESRGRGEMVVRGVSPPLCNVSILFDGVEFRVDNWWDDLAVAAEADGEGKYGRRYRQIAPSQVLWQEKLRQDWLVERLDIPVLRYVDREVRFDADGLVERLQRKFNRRRVQPWDLPEGVEVFQRPFPGSGAPIRWLRGGPRASI